MGSETGMALENNIDEIKIWWFSDELPICQI